jgi:hypothetical protein
MLALQIEATRSIFLFFFQATEVVVKKRSNSMLMFFANLWSGQSWRLPKFSEALLESSSPGD